MGEDSFLTVSKRSRHGKSPAKSVHSDQESDTGSICSKEMETYTPKEHVPLRYRPDRGTQSHLGSRRSRPNAPTNPLPQAPSEHTQVPEGTNHYDPTDRVGPGYSCKHDFPREPPSQIPSAGLPTRTHHLCPPKHPKCHPHVPLDPSEQELVPKTTI